jgi:hypothetical protein
MTRQIQLTATALIAVAIGCAREDSTTTDARSDANASDATVGSTTNAEAPMTYADGAAGSMPTTNQTTHDDSQSQTVTAAKVAAETREALQTTGKFVAQNKDELVAEVREELRDVNTKLDEMQAQADSLSAEARSEFQQRWQTVTEKREALKTKLDELSASTGDAWRELRDGTQQAWDEFAGAVDKAADQFDRRTDASAKPAEETPGTGDPTSPNR